MKILIGYDGSECADGALHDLKYAGLPLEAEALVFTVADVLLPAPFLDIKEKLKEKLGVDFRNYTILGACNPPLAYQTLQADLDVGLLLPCNVIVYEQNGKVVVSAIDAAKMMTIVNNPALETMAKQVNTKLRRVIDSL